MNEARCKRRRWLHFRLRTLSVLVTLTMISGCLPPDSPPDVDSLNALCFSPDGKVLAAGGYRQVDLWDATTGKPIRTVSEHLSEVYSVGFSPDGRYLASGGRDRYARVFNSTTGHVVATLEAEQSVVSTIFSPDNCRLISADLSGGVIFWNTDDWKEEWRFKSGIQIMAAALSPAGQLLATGGGDGRIRLWSTETAQQVAILEEHATASARIRSLYSTANRRRTGFSETSGLRISRSVPSDRWSSIQHSPPSPSTLINQEAGVSFMLAQRALAHL